MMLDKYHNDAQECCHYLQQNGVSLNLESVYKAVLCSDYFYQTVLSEKFSKIVFFQENFLHKKISLENISEDIKIAGLPEAEAMKYLRQVRQAYMLRWIYRDANELAPVVEVMQELSDFADACLQATLDFCSQELYALYGQPIGEESNKLQQLVILGMGKLGAQELNLSSDIDLIFAYDEGGETNGKRVISNQEFFVKLGQKIIRLLDFVTEDGFVFRVDMRLRPWGDGSALASSFAAMESYYEQHGREWERYALIKARVCAGDKAAGSLLTSMLRPFVFRRYIDFGAFESLREMKVLIEREMRRKGMEDNIKLGRGGIREIEFIVQAFQLIRGGVDKRLQQRELLYILPLLAELQLLPVEVTDFLREAYLFLRQVEHRLQAYLDRQTQILPQDANEQMHLALGLGFSSWSEFYACLEKYRVGVEVQFNNVIVAREDKEKTKTSIGEVLWNASQEELTHLLTQHQFQSAEECATRIVHLRESKIAQSLQEVPRARLHKLMPLFLQLCTEQDDKDHALLRCLPLIESVLRRSAYLMLLVENVEALKRLINLCAASPWIAEELTRYPVLLDELLNARTLFSPLPKAEITAELRQIMLRVPEDDVEAQMEALRIFKKGQVLRVAASDITGALPLMKVSDSLTWIAEAVLEEALLLVWRQLVKKHGQPHDVEGRVCAPGFVVVGYGKLGGLELGYGSDLDLVFLHKADPHGETDGAQPLDNASFFARLGQKMIAFLTTATRAGELYEVDMRLRPSGNSGLLVTSLAGFLHYQEQDAWTWEHQALVRARVVAGDASLAQDFEALRKVVLTRPRELPTLRAEIIEMREKMRQHLSSEAGGKKSSVFDLKHDSGGIVDIEFMVQYAALAWAHQVPELIRYSDNIRILESLAQHGLMVKETADALRDIYLQYRARGHRLALAKASNQVAATEFSEQRAFVQRTWQQLMNIELC